MTDFRSILNETSFRDWEFHLNEGHGSLGPTEPWLQVRFKAYDATTGEIEMQHGRKWRISQHMSKSEFVQTALKAVLAAVEHEAREDFMYKGAKVFGPHLDIEALVALAGLELTDRRD